MDILALSPLEYMTVCRRFDRFCSNTGERVDSRIETTEQHCSSTRFMHEALGRQFLALHNTVSILPVNQQNIHH